MTETDELRATRDAYDAMAAHYAEVISGMWRDRPFDLAMFAAFAELVRKAGGGPVADLGCGPGHLTKHLSTLGLDAFGVDLSPAMIEIARAAYPDVTFEVGSMTALDLDAGSLSGVLAHYSTIHTSPAHLPQLLTEIRRVLVPGGYLHLAFLADRGSSELGQPYDHKVALAYRWSPDRLSRLLDEIGFSEVARLLEEPAADAKRPYPAAHLVVVRS
ncbi:MAG TPA: class I SAM-dependent methyltransferase [Actinocrinis sp.]|uniref:class I SAM-dependent methyltransferase n=1 Tax=Actinocrinis sp. TaxID=1920516 RepID=UPI002DDD8784|nr:class I SAM-dependent methyltransferase [Actinocrinis sp.]HEV3170564.1 class I SAM-dependent methyltransferase [Actinocrinis sp.]